MNPNTAFSASLVTSLVLWYPSMQACLRGDLDLTPAALRYLAALAVSCLAMNFLARLLGAYRAGQHPEPSVQDASAAGAPTAPLAAAAPIDSDPGTPHRRRTDRAAADGNEDPASLAA